MRKVHKLNVKNSIFRFAIIALATLLQVELLCLLFFVLNKYFAIINVFLIIIALILVLYIYVMHENAALRTSWIILILVSPVIGVILFFLYGNGIAAWKMNNYFLALEEKLFDA